MEQSALAVNPYNLTVYGFLVVVLLIAVRVLWNKLNSRDKKIEQMFVEMKDALNNNTRAMDKLTETIIHMKSY